ncbi:MFS transporter [Marispirochaeta aestuarii]|uniref:MFS transporter n=1 Tax=Marispirochaeta aestuarii TaxID=1963862 RepID=UPI0029C78DCD|nr:MFS transporter [Marispirochaeta aestuarii]
MSLGLPDSILGVAIPVIQREWGIELSTAGLISMVSISGGIIYSFLSGYITEKIGTSRITFISILMTSLALFGFSVAPSFAWLLLLAVPLGVGGGAVDASLNHYVALHFRAHHMNWLHSFWGIGATLGPLIMSRALEQSGSWQPGARTIAFLQLFMATLILLSLPIWRKHQALVQPQGVPAEGKKETKGSPGVFKLPGIVYALLTMLLYCGVEVGLGLWGSSYLVHVRNFSIEGAASWIAMYYGGITAGRFLSGIISFRLSNVRMIRMGIIIALAGILILLMPLPDALLGLALVLVGLGLSPVFPAMIHEVPARFGREASRKVIGFQMGFAYVGSAYLPPLLGVILQNTGLVLLPFILLGFLTAMFAASERLTCLVRRRISDIDQDLSLQ